MIKATMMAIATIAVMISAPLNAQSIQPLSEESELFSIDMVLYGATTPNPDGLAYQLSQISPTLHFLICRKSEESGSVIRMNTNGTANFKFEKALKKIDTAEFPGILQVGACAFVDSKTQFTVVDGGGRYGNRDLSVAVTVTPLPASYFE